jgi:hypothetical protein
VFARSKKIEEEMRAMRSVKSLGMATIAISSACLLACSGLEPTPKEAQAEVDVRTGALVVNQANTFGFEDSTHWTSTVAVTSSTTRTQGAKSLAVAAKNYVEVTSAALPSLTGVTSTIGMDVRLPSAQPNPNWYGFVQLVVSVPSKGVNNQFIGQVDLTGKPLNQFFPVDFDLPASLVATLQAGGYSDFRAKIVINVPHNVTGNYLFDNLHFLAGAVGTTDLVETNILSRWAHGSNAGPTNTTLSVLTGSQAYLGQSALRAVTDAGFDFFLRFTAVTPVDIGTDDALRVASRALNVNDWQLAAPVVVIEDATGARMTLASLVNKLPSNGVTWIDLKVPLAGGLGWIKTGTADLHAVRAIELHTDTWDSGFTWDIDAVQFTKLFDTCTGTPASLSASSTARATTATVTYSAVSGAVGYDIYRSVSGGPPVFINRARTTTYEDFGLALNTTYGYTVKPFMAANCESGSAVTTVTTRTNANGLSRVPTLRVLLPIYNAPSNPYTAADIARIKAGVELSRQWYYRNSSARLNLTLDFLEINMAPPSTGPGDGPTMEFIEADLRARGIADGQYEGIYGIARGLNGCWGGFTILGAVGAYGTTCGVPYPTNDTSADTTMTWVFTHEFNHALDTLAAVVGADLFNTHPDSQYQDMAYFGPIIDAGEHFDWLSQTMRLFTAYDTLAAPFNDYLEVDDPDGDRLASADARVPWDEARFGSNANLADTDGDGLNDRAEYAAGRFGASNPVLADTDGDGQNDGVDPTPRARLAASMTALTPAIDGVREAGYTLFRNGVEFSNVPGFTAATYIAYDANNFYILAEESQSASLFIHLDGSGANGFWQGENTYSFSLTPGQSQPRNHTSRHGTTEDPGVAPAGSALFTRTVGSTTILEARIPRANLGQGFGWTGGTTTGFSTSVGTVLGLRITYTQIGGVGDLFAEPWATVNEYFHFDDVTLQ